jgi:2-polyprenyl-6-methoxyphenol hydroxylase-like FAD-dependent oxidoreductase
MAGQGASVAMGSAWMLAKQLRTRSSTQEALRHYEQTMRPFVAQTQRTGRRTAQWLVPGTTFGITLRRLTLAAMRAPGAMTLFAPSLRRMLASVVPK